MNRTSCALVMKTGNNRTAVGSCFVSVCCSMQRATGSVQFVLCLWASRWLQSLYHVMCKEMALQTVF